MSAPVIQGWCPGAYRPMLSGDGLVMRVRPPLSRITPAQLTGLANLASRFGTGMIEATSRANLQIRGVTEAGFRPILTALQALNLIDPTPEVEARRTIILSPFRHDPWEDRVAQALVTALMTRPPLPSKFGFVMDTASPTRQLAGISGDIRLERAGSGLVLRADGAALGRLVRDADEVLEKTLGLVDWFQSSGGVGADGRGRMRRHLASGASLPLTLRGDTPPSDAAPPPMPGRNADGFAIGVAFGIFPAAALRQIAAATTAPLRVTPFRMLQAATLDAAAVTHPDLVLHPDPILSHVHCCTGAPGCAQTKLATREIARQLARMVPQGQTLHVSGCSKGCAFQGKADVTLVGRGAQFDLIRQGHACDAPHKRGLNPASLAQIFGPSNAL